MKRRLLFATAALAAALALGTVASADNGGTPFHIALSGANEVNASGAPTNPHGSADRGSVQLTLNQGQEEICWTFGAITLTSGELLPTAGHIHEGAADTAGAVVVTLFNAATAPTSYPTETVCVNADRELIKEIRKDPENYYVNLHNATHESGVIRGQLR